MKAFAQSDTLYIREGSQVLAGYLLQGRDPRKAVDTANAKLRGVGITGDDGEAWVARRRVATAVIREVMAEVAA